jgi:prophage regulatory protein
MHAPIQPSLLDQKTILRMIGIGSRETLSRWIRHGQFPAPIHVGGGRLRWLRVEVEAWIADRAVARDTERGAPSRETRRVAARTGTGVRSHA